MFGRQRRSGHGDDGDGNGGGSWMEQGKPVDLREMPRFTAPAVSARAALAGTVGDLLALALMTVLGFALALVGFLRYDVRPG